MEFNIRNISYGTFSSHTFPGFLFLTNIFFLIYLVLPKKCLQFICFFSFDDIYKTILIILILFILSNILGSVLDSIRYILFKKQMAISTEYETTIINNITKDDLEIYKYFLGDDEWYQFETFGNIAIALLPGNISLLILLIKNNLSALFSIALLIVYFLLNVLIFIAAFLLLKENLKIEESLKERFTKKGNYIENQNM